MEKANELETKELRIGNWYRSVKFNTDVQCTLEDFYNLCAMSDGATDDPPINEMFEPIPLTEEWLLKFGFEYNGGDGYKAPHNTEHWYFTLRNGFMPNSIARGSVYTDGYKGCEYVHQLQNLYFALTGEELEIKKVN